ncbi:MAG: hypothetical protein WBB85_02070 [Albidovulum sp.]|uniref:hypothetical protein n=1 Tax=Albidovulum sp. TaxID=1872424 RepID=UPI003C8D069F
MDESQDVINADDWAFKGHIPMVFARLVNERFAEKAATEATVKVTAAKHLVRNRMARPDTWENKAIEGKFLMEARSEIVHNGSTVKDAEIIKAQAAFALCFEDITDRLPNLCRSLDEATNTGLSSKSITNVKFGSDLLFSAPAKKA